MSVIRKVVIISLALMMVLLALTGCAEAPPEAISGNGYSYRIDEKKFEEEFIELYMTTITQEFLMRHPASEMETKLHDYIQKEFNRIGVIIEFDTDK